MTIRIEDMHEKDFSDIATGEKLQPIHPGETLREEFLIPLKMTPHALFLALQVPPRRALTILCGNAVRSPWILRLSWRDISAPARNSGWDCKPATTWQLRAPAWAMH